MVFLTWMCSNGIYRGMASWKFAFGTVAFSYSLTMKAVLLIINLCWNTISFWCLCSLCALLCRRHHWHCIFCLLTAQDFKIRYFILSCWCSLITRDIFVNHGSWCVFERSYWSLLNCSNWDLMLRWRIAFLPVFCWVPFIIYPPICTLLGHLNHQFISAAQKPFGPQVRWGDHLPSRKC